MDIKQLVGREWGGSYLCWEEARHQSKYLSVVIRSRQRVRVLANFHGAQKG